MHAVMPTISDLPDEVLELILQHVITAAPSLQQADGTSSGHRDDTFHRVADWYTLARVDSRYVLRRTCMPADGRWGASAAQAHTAPKYQM